MLDFPRWKTILVLLVGVFAIALALPNVVPAMRDAESSWVPHRTVSLGLDLQGGSHLLLEVDTAYYRNEQLEHLVGDVRAALNEKGLGYRGLRVQGDSVQFSFRNEGEREAVIRSVGEVDPRMELSEEGGVVTLQFQEKAWEDARHQLLSQSIEIVRRRVDETGTREPIIQRQGDARILLQVPGLDDPERLKQLLGQTAKLTFHMVNTSVSPAMAQAGAVPPGSRRLDMEDPLRSGEVIVIERRAILDGTLLVDARATFERNQAVVSFRFNNKGARIFGDVTKDNVGKPFAIVLDDKVISAPVIREPILGGSGIISGSFTVQSANDLALLLRAGALPAPLSILEERTVGPSLGADSIEAGSKALMLGILLVMLFMIVTYGRFGIYSDLALLLNMVLIVAALSLFQATLTLPGIAGIVLTMGMAVDANVLIFERIHEETRNGKTPFAAVDNGFRRAFQTILDSNITTLIAAIILFYFGSGAVKGFAVTLSIGILASMFSAILFTRMLVVHWVRRARPKELKI